MTFNSVLYIAKKNWSYTFWQLVLFKNICGAFFKLVISLLQTKCSYTILYCTVGCCLASKSSFDLVRSRVWMVFFGCCCFREYTDQIGLTFWVANFKARKFNRTFIWIHMSWWFSWDWVYSFLVHFGLNLTVLQSLMYWWLQIVSTHCVWCWVNRYAHHDFWYGIHLRHSNPSIVFLSGRVNILTPPAGTLLLYSISNINMVTGGNKIKTHLQVSSSSATKLPQNPPLDGGCCL